MKHINRIIIFFILIFIFILMSFQAFSAVNVRLKDIAKLRGIRENQLIGYGLVVGLNGRGDSSRSKLTKQTIRNLLKNLGINVQQNSLISANSAVVIVTAVLSPFSKEGDRIDINVSSLADARSLAGGILIQTQLKAADNTVYAVAQGQVLVGGNQKTTLTVGRIPKGAIVEKSVNSVFLRRGIVRISIKDQDFTTMENIRKAITGKYPGIVLRIEDPTTIAVTIPVNLRNNPIGFISALEILEVSADTSARVVVDGKSGTIVMGENVKIGVVAVSYNGIEISIGFTGKKGSSFMLSSGSSIKTLVDGLNKIGAKSGDIINILQAIEKAGALKAKLVIM